jgi:hypothetical protein
VKETKGDNDMNKEQKATLSRNSFEQLCQEAIQPLCECWDRTLDTSAVDEFFDATGTCYSYLKYAFKISMIVDIDNVEMLYKMVSKDIGISVYSATKLIKDEFADFISDYDEILERNPKVSVIAFIKRFANYVRM